MKVKSGVRNKKKPLCRSGSESDDFEKYTYFDEGKVKRKIKLDPELNDSELKKQIRSIESENILLKAECERINLLKLNERLRLRIEIRRLKSLVSELKLQNYNGDKKSLDVCNTIKLIASLNRILFELDDHKNHISDEFIKQLNLIQFTTRNFWKDFNKIDSKAPKPLWVGNLKDIRPDCISYFVPDVENRVTEKNIVYFPNEDNSEADEKSLDSIDSDGSNIDDDIQISALIDETKDREILSRNDESVEPEINVAELCKECNCDISWTSFIERHREAYQNEVKLAACNTCNMRFLKSGHFDGKHRRSKHREKVKSRPRQFMCDVCGQGYMSTSALTQHRAVHEQARYACPHCDYKCHRKGYLKVHIETHFRTRPEHVPKETTRSKVMYACDKCDFTTAKSSFLKFHKVTHGDKFHQCKVCPFVTKSSSSYTVHVRKHCDRQSKSED